MKLMRMLPLPTLAAASGSSGVSNQTAASTATAVMQDKRKVSQETRAKLLAGTRLEEMDKRHKKCEELASDRISTFSTKPYFDCRKDSIMV